MGVTFRLREREDIEDNVIRRPITTMLAGFARSRLGARGLGLAA
jgi:hypothetical protein